MILLTEGQATMSRMFDLDWQLVADSCLMLIAIFVLFFALSYLLFDPARKMLQARKDKIRDELLAAEQNMEESKALKEEYEMKLKEIDKEAEGILSDARKRALDNESKIVAEAKDEANRIMNRAHVEAELEKQKLSDEVKQEIISVASLMAGKVVAASIDTTVQEQLLNDTLKEMGDDTWLN